MRSSARRPRSSRRARSRAVARHAGAIGADARQSGDRQHSSRARGSTARAPRRRPGTSRSISPAPASTTRSATRSASCPTNDPALVEAVIKALDAPADFPIGGRTPARGADRRRVARARARHAVPALFLPHRRRAAAEGEGARGRRRPGRRRRDARRARGDREVPRRPPRSGSLHRGARSAAAAALFDLVLAEDQSGPRVAHRRHGALPDRQARAPRRRLDLPRRTRQAERAAEGLRAEGACLRPAAPIRRHRSS